VSDGRGKGTPMQPRELSQLLDHYRGVAVLEHSVSWTPAAWRQPSGHPLLPFNDLVEELAAHTCTDGNRCRISRADVFGIADRDPVELFVTAMIFGFGDRGYGPSRTAKMLATPGAIEKIGEAHRLLSLRGAVEAHRHMINRPGRLAWCRTPFITKFLYFAGFATAPGLRPLIFDQFVRDRLALYGPDLRLHYSDDYAQYLQFATQAADEYKLGRADIVELALFRGEPASLPRRHASRPRRCGPQ
jgi:hypothetical protein